MKIFAFVDTHGSEKAFAEIKKKVKKEKPDLILCAGDMSVFGHNLGKILKKFNQLGTDVLLIRGNHEDNEPLDKLCKHYARLHFIDGGHFIKGDVLVLGYEGECFSQSDPEFKKVGKDFAVLIKKHKGKKVVLMTHAPPFNTALDLIDEEHAGNKPIRKFIDKEKPLVVVSGHLHENFGKKEVIGETLVVNPGPKGVFFAV